MTDLTHLPLINHIDTYILCLSWSEYARKRPQYPAPDQPLTKVWRDYHEVLESAWYRLMKAWLPRDVWLVLDDLYQKRLRLRQAWLKEGGLLVTQRGNRRRKIPTSYPPQLNAVFNAQLEFNKFLPQNALTSIDIALLVCSGVLTTERNGSRRRSLRRIKATFTRHLRRGVSPLPTVPQSLVASHTESPRGE